MRPENHEQDAHHRSRDHQRPGDDLPAAELARQPRSFRITEPQTVMAPSISMSPKGAAVMPCETAKPTTRALPRIENSQKAGFGRSPPRTTAKIAVASGSSPTKTIEWAAVTYCSASAV